jgi:glycosyltransferase involved in cell wall biosynthesis
MKIIMMANTDWYLYNFRLSLAESIRSNGDQLTLLSPHGPYVQKLKNMGFNWIEIYLSRKRNNPFKEIVTINQIASIYRSEKPDLVHHFTVKCVIYGSLAAKLTGVKKIINAITGLGYIFLNENLNTRIVRWIVKKFYLFSLRNTMVVFQNEDDLQLFQRNSMITQGQAIVIPGSGVDIDEFKPVKEPEGIPSVILIARLLRDKGVYEFVEAAKMIIGQFYHARFILVGDIDEGNPASLTQNELQEWVKKGFIEWWGWRDDVINVYHCANIICLPSYREGISRTLIEAGACGKPLVTTNVPGCKQVVIDGENGFVVPQKNAEELAKALIKLIINPKLRKEMGIRSREIVTKKFSSSIINSQTLNLYEMI